MSSNDPDFCGVVIYEFNQRHRSRQPQPEEYQRHSITYNVGHSAFIHSTLLKKLNNSDIPAACDELRRWIMAGGQHWQGLINRREVERELCLMPPLIKATEG